jgi:tRNA(fMet)-specific endonuclease VapC
VKYLLDTDICIYLMKNRSEKILKRLKTLEPGDVGISSITLAELHYGVEKSLFPERNREALEAFALPLEVAEFGAEAAVHYGAVRAALARKGTPIGGNDLFIAAHALALGVPLVTNNLREFRRVPGLKVEGWA